MKSLAKLRRAAIGLAVAMAAQASAAEPARPAPDPADPDAAVPPTRYKSVLPYRQPRQHARTPDQDWKALNQTVGSINSMSLTMGGGDEPAPAEAAPQAGQPHEHRHHHGMQQ